MTIRVTMVAMTIMGLLAVPAGAVDTTIDDVNVRLDMQIDFQGATFDTGNSSSQTDGNIDWTVRLNLEKIFNNGWLVGMRGEVDQDFDVESDASATNNNVQLDELYVYVASRWGRVEVGDQDGPADTFSLHAPTIGTGQIRGDFSRYASAGARLKPFDSRDAFKVIYLSPPIGGLRFGASWGPELRVDKDSPIATRRTLQRDHVELAAQYQTPIAENVVLAVSGAYVTANSNPITGRQDISSWSTGAEMRWNKLRLGGAFVSRGDSNAGLGRNEEEINAGVNWRENKWAAAASFAHITRTGRSRNLYGVGGSLDVGDHFIIRTDLVVFDETFTSGFTRNGVVALVDFRVRY